MKSLDVAVVLASDDNYSMGLGVTIASFLRFITPDYKIFLYIIDGGISQANKKRLKKIVESSKVNVEIKFTIPDTSTFENLLCVDHINHFNSTVFYRLLIPTLVDVSFEKAIYLDSDLLVRSDISKLWEIEIGDYALLA